MCKYRIRFRFKLAKKLNIDEHEHRIEIHSNEVALSPQQTDAKICDSEWLVMNARAFNAEDDALLFANKLKMACEVSSIIARLGIDAGTDLQTSGFSKVVKDRIKEQTGIITRNDVHGIDVFQDDPAVRIASMHGNLTVRTAPNPFLSEISDVFDQVERASKKTKDIVLLLNYALLRPDPVSQIVFAFSAVEMLGQDQAWNANQKKLLDALALEAQESELASCDERAEVADAILKGMYKLSLRQGVLRLLSSHSLDHLKRDWDALYGERSTLVHGLAPKPGMSYGDLANRAVTLCGHILLTVIAEELPIAKKHLEVYYKIEQSA